MQGTYSSLRDEPTDKRHLPSWLRHMRGRIFSLSTQLRDVDNEECKLLSTCYDDISEETERRLAKLSSLRNKLNDEINTLNERVWSHNTVNFDASNSHFESAHQALPTDIPLPYEPPHHDRRLSVDSVVSIDSEPSKPSLLDLSMHGEFFDPYYANLSPNEIPESPKEKLQLSIKRLSLASNGDIVPRTQYQHDIVAHDVVMDALREEGVSITDEDVEALAEDDDDDEGMAQFWQDQYDKGNISDDSYCLEICEDTASSYASTSRQTPDITGTPLRQSLAGLTRHDSEIVDHPQPLPLPPAPRYACFAEVDFTKLPLESLRGWARQFGLKRSVGKTLLLHKLTEIKRFLIISGNDENDVHVMNLSEVEEEQPGKPKRCIMQQAELYEWYEGFIRNDAEISDAFLLHACNPIDAKGIFEKMKTRKPEIGTFKRFTDFLEKQKIQFNKSNKRKRALIGV